MAKKLTWLLQILLNQKVKLCILIVLILMLKMLYGNL